MHKNETRFLLLAASLHGRKWRALSLKGDSCTGCGIKLPVGQGLPPSWELRQWLWRSLLMMDKINLLWRISTGWKMLKSGPKEGHLLEVEGDTKSCCPFASPSARDLWRGWSSTWPSLAALNSSLAFFPKENTAPHAQSDAVNTPAALCLTSLKKN